MDRVDYWDRVRVPETISMAIQRVRRAALKWLRVLFG